MTDRQNPIIDQPVTDGGVPLAGPQQIADIEQTAAPEPGFELAARQASTPVAGAEVQALFRELDITDTQSVLFFGSKAQDQLTTVSDQMLEGVRNKDVGAAGSALNDMVTTLRGFDLDGIDPNIKPGFFGRLFGKAKPVAQFLQEYEEVRIHIDRITVDLERHKTQLMRDVASLDRLYEANLGYFHALEDYVQAGELKLQEVDDSAIPALAARAETGGELLQAQQLRDLRAVRDDLERRVHDLKLTRQVAMQALPSIRLVQENDKGLINKINSTLVNTVPLWRQQLAQAVTIYRSGRAAETVKSATDLTNELLQSNADNLKLANAEARKQMERGVFDIEVVKQANQTLIDTIEESLQIADEGKAARVKASAELTQLEADLRRTLTSARANADKAVSG